MFRSCSAQFCGAVVQCVFYKLPLSMWSGADAQQRFVGFGNSSVMSSGRHGFLALGVAIYGGVVCGVTSPSLSTDPWSAMRCGTDLFAQPGLGDPLLLGAVYARNYFSVRYVVVGGLLGTW